MIFILCYVHKYDFLFSHSSLELMTTITDFLYHLSFLCTYLNCILNLPSSCINAASTHSSCNFHRFHKSYLEISTWLHLDRLPSPSGILFSIALHTPVASPLPPTYVVLLDLFLHFSKHPLVASWGRFVYRLCFCWEFVCLKMSSFSPALGLIF